MDQSCPRLLGGSSVRVRATKRSLSTRSAFSSASNFSCLPASTSPAGAVHLARESIQKTQPRRGRGGGGTPLHAPVHRVAYGRSLPTHRGPLREGRMTAIVGSPLGGCKGRELQLRVLKTCCPPRALATRLGQSRASLLGASALLLLRLVPGVPEVLRAGLARVVRRVARVPAAIAERGLPRAPHGASSTHGAGSDWESGPL